MDEFTLSLGNPDVEFMDICGQICDTAVSRYKYLLVAWQLQQVIYIVSFEVERKKRMSERQRPLLENDNETKSENDDFKSDDISSSFHSGQHQYSPSGNDRNNDHNDRHDDKFSDHENGDGKQAKPPGNDDVDFEKYASMKDDQGRSVCKDFLRNVCSRGTRCKFYHPTELEENRPRKQFYFCHDYSNRGCFRSNCRFIHCPRDDEETYKKTGKVSEVLARAILLSGQGSSDDIAGIPICKDYLTGSCQRGRSRCRYWHIDPSQPLAESQSTGVTGSRYGQGTPPAQTGLSLGGSAAWEYGRGGTASSGSYYSPVSEYHDYGSGGPLGRSLKRSRMELEPDPPIGSFAILSEENAILRAKIDSLNKQVADLTSANEVLLQQNSNLRAKLQASTPSDAMMTAASVAAAAATISSALTSSAPSAGASAAPLAAAIAANAVNSNYPY